MKLVNRAQLTAVCGLAALALVAAACSSNNNSNNGNNTAKIANNARAPVNTVVVSPTSPSLVAGAAVSPSPAALAGAATFTLIATDNKYSETKLTAKAGQPISLTLKNNGSAIHNWDLLDQKDANGKDIKTSLLDAGKSETITFTIAKAGTYNFHCDVHPDDMKGTLTIS
jgi:plastocyanin